MSPTRLPTEGLMPRPFNRVHMSELKHSRPDRIAAWAHWSGSVHVLHMLLTFEFCVATHHMLESSGQLLDSGALYRQHAVLQTVVAKGHLAALVHQSPDFHGRCM